jgi:hypothetical protein
LSSESDGNPGHHDGGHAQDRFPVRVASD